MKSSKLENIFSVSHYKSISFDIKIKETFTVQQQKIICQHNFIKILWKKAS